VRSLAHNRMIGLRVPLDGNAPTIPSITAIYANANWFERELWDMFGIRFDGHPDLRRLVMPYDWVGHPLRKDYPLGYEEVQFSFNFDEIDVRKPYAKE
jgi:NADH-quinone oxidoreductase subunit C